MPTPDANALSLSDLVAAIDDGPDKLHAESTPATEALIDLGIEALPAVIPLLASPAADTRMRAAHVLEMVTMEQAGFRRGHGWDDFAHEIRWRDFWSAMMGEGADDPGEPRAASRVAHWQSWLDRHRRGGRAKAI